MPWRPWGTALFARQVPENVYCQGVGFMPWRGSGSGRIYTAPGSDVPSGVPRALLLLRARHGTIKTAKTRIFYLATLGLCFFCVAAVGHHTHSLTFSGTHTTTHSHTHSLTLLEHAYWHTYSPPPSMLHYTQTSVSLLAFLCSLAGVWETQSYRMDELLLITDSRAGLPTNRYVVPVFSCCLWLPTYLFTYLSTYLSFHLVPVTQNCLANLQIWNPFLRNSRQDFVIAPRNILPDQNPA